MSVQIILRSITGRKEKELLSQPQLREGQPESLELIFLSLISYGPLAEEKEKQSQAVNKIPNQTNAGWAQFFGSYGLFQCPWRGVILCIGFAPD